VLLLVEAGFFAFATLLTLLILTNDQMNPLTIPGNARVLQPKLSPRNSISTPRRISLAVGARATCTS
jgi:hypothetical protein